MKTMNVEKDFVIMMVDDDPDEHFIIGIALSSIAQQVTLLNYYNVPDALRKLKTMDVLPNLLILDIYLPCKDGLAMLGDLKSSEILRNIPVMMYSGMFSAQVLENAEKMGVTLFQQKTPNMKQLAASLEGKIETLMAS